jgi:hypothetical protein
MRQIVIVLSITRHIKTKIMYDLFVQQSSSLSNWSHRETDMSTDSGPHSQPSSRETKVPDDIDIDANVINGVLPAILEPKLVKGLSLHLTNPNDPTH